jgi:hypothetical protein
LTGPASDARAGDIPPHTWRWGLHTGAAIEMTGTGPGAALLAGAEVSHAEVHTLLRALVDGVEPELGVDHRLLPDGRTGELRHRVTVQKVDTGFGAGWNQLDALRLDASRHGLAIGLDGLFEEGENAVVVLIDIDAGAGTGLASLNRALEDRDGVADAILSNLAIDGPAVEGFGADFALVVWGGFDPPREARWSQAGLRGLRPPFGQVDELGWHRAAVSFAGEVRPSGEPLAPSSGRGLEVLIPWVALYPALAGAVPPGARLGISAILVNPGRARVTLPGLIEWTVDRDLDGVGEGDLAPEVRIP